MLTKYVEFDAICDGCGLSLCSNAPYSWDSTLDPMEGDNSDSIGTAVNKRGLNKLIKKHKWIYTEGKKHFCPNCQRRLGIVLLPSVRKRSTRV